MSLERFKECAVDEQGKIYFDYFEEGVRVLIMRGPSSVNCYLGVPSDHPLADFGYDDLPVDCHGGLTFGSGSNTSFPTGFFWYGYDYGHCDDMSFYDLRYPSSLQGKPWTPEEIKKDSWSAIYSFRKLVNLAEGIVRKRAAKQ